MLRPFYTFLLVLFQISFLLAQDYFQRDVNFELNQRTSSISAISVSDLNGDFLDDIQLIQDNKLIVLYQRPDKSFEKVEIVPFIMQGEIYSITCADFDQNGWCDIIVNGSTVPAIFYQDSLGEFRRDFSGITSFIAQSSNAVDIDNDGLLDLFVCNDNALSNTYKNLGPTLEPFTFLDMRTDPVSDNSGNYGSIWFDLEGDGDLDLYISKCRAGVDDPNDPRRINALFINENGNFREAADEFGIAIGRQSWSVTAGDIDNDGDEDLLVTNHYAKSQILVNETDTFSIIELEIGDLFPIQGIFSDINLDGYQDILLSTLSDEVALINNNGSNFTLENHFLGDYDNGISITKGDLNNDGFEDVFAQNAGNGVDQVFLSKNSLGNHYLKVSLSSFNDMNAIGNYVEIFGPWGVQSRRIQAGESYGICVSKDVVFGLSQHSIIDSLVVSWSNNSTSTFYSLDANQHIRIDEGGCLEHLINLETDVIFNCDSLVEISLPDGYISYEWSDGLRGQTRQLGDGIYHAKLERADGCFDQIYPIQIKPYRSDTLSSYIESDNSILCVNDNVTLTAKIEGSYLWSTGETSKSIIVAEAGEISLQVTDVCGSLVEDQFIIDEGSIPAPASISDTIRKGESYIFDFLNDSVLIRNNELDFEFWGTSYEIDELDSSQTYFLSNIELNQGQVDSLGLLVPSTAFASNQINAGIIFNVYRNTILKSVDVYTEVEGSRKFIILNDEGKVIHSKLVPVMSGYNTIDLDFILFPGTDFIIQTEEIQNRRLFQSPGPNFSRSQNNVEDAVDFPYEIDGSIELTSTLFGSNNYYYFYNWQIEHNYAFCESERSKAEIIVKNPSNSTKILDDSSIRISPNPTQNSLWIDASNKDFTRIRLSDLNGKLIIDHNFENVISLAELKAGIYILELSGKSGYYMEKVMKL